MFAGEVLQRRLIRTACLLLLVGCSFIAFAKEKPLNAIILFPTDSGGIAYVQVGDFLLNGKPELVICNGQQSLDSAGLRRLGKTTLSVATGFERTADGALMMKSTAGSDCVLPANLKLDGKRTYTIKELADMTTVMGAVTSYSNNTTPTIPTILRAGTEIIMVDAPDVELAEYLRAKRENTVASWNAFAAQFPTSARVKEAKQAQADLIVAEGEASLATFRRTEAGRLPIYAELKKVKESAARARQVVSQHPGALKLQAEVERTLKTLAGSAKEAIEAYKRSLNEHTPGYNSLKRAQTLLEQARVVDPLYPEVESMYGLALQQLKVIDLAIASAEEKLTARNVDDAYTAIEPYASFDSEVPRIAAVIDAAFRTHRDRAVQAAQASDFRSAIVEYQRALEFRKDPATSDALAKAQAEQATIDNKAAAQQAIEASRLLSSQKQFVEAYEKLESLPEAQRAFVQEEMDALKVNYAQDLVKRGTQLSRIHIPIKGKADQDGAGRAYEYLSKAADILNDETLKLRIEVLGDKISEWYLTSARRLLGKPRGTGTGLGWLTLLEGQLYKGTPDIFRDEITRYKPEYETRAKLSIGVQFRDQTSRREGVGYGDQLADTLSARLENTDIRGVKIIPRTSQGATPDPNSTATDPNLMLMGDVLQHRVDRDVKTENLSSHFRAGQRDVRNPAWTEASRAVEAAQQAYDKANDEYKTNLPRMKRPQIAEAEANLKPLADKLAEAKAKLQAIPETVVQDVIQPYNYLKKTITLTAVVEVTVRPGESPADISRDPETVKKTTTRTAVVLENVKPEDSDGIVAQGSAPDDNQVLAEAEAQAQDELVQKIVARLKGLPPKILEEARARAGQGDMEGAAERYILYLNTTPDAQSPERVEAEQFLRREFHISGMKG